MGALKLRKIGSSTGVIFSKDMLNHLHAQEGQEVYVTPVPGGLNISVFDPEVIAQIQLGEEIMDSNKELFAALAK